MGASNEKNNKKHLLYALFIFSIVGNICFYTKNSKAKQEVISITEELTEKAKENEAVTSELTKSEEEVAAALAELAKKDEAVTAPKTELTKEKVKNKQETFDEAARFAAEAAAIFMN